MALAQIVDGQPVELLPGRDVVIGDAVTSYASVMIWSAEDRAEAGLLLIAEPDPAPAGQTIASTSLEVVDGEVRRVAAYAPARRLISKDVVMARLDSAGLVDAAQAALLRRPVLFGRWFHKDWPEVYADDTDMVAMLTAIGADVAAITAA